MMFRMRSFLCLLLLCARLAASAPPLRWLEDVEDGDNSEEDLSQYTVTQGNCFRMKIVGDNDDDGNSYFYNGAYRAQYKRYISYSMCASDGTCHAYVSTLDDYLDQTVAYVQNWCGTCAAKCRRRLATTTTTQRKLDDAAAAEAEMNVNCNTCANQCKLLNSNKGNSGKDESGYLACQAGNEDGDIQYYTAPQCENDRIVIGTFYDNECTIKTSTTASDEGFSYNTFQTVETLKVDCSVSNDACANLYANSVFCDEGYAGGDQQDANLCKAAASAARVNTYYSKPFYQKVPIGLIIFLVMLLGFGVGFLSYTYYIRHRRSKMTPMANLDGNTDLPDIS